MSPRYQPWLHRFAVITAAVALLLPITVGALVTTYDAGMAFPDWPSSDGHNMVLYPWLKSVGDKFLEHGHRLAGMLVGMISVGLAGVFCYRESRLWVRCLAVAVLLGVIGQGILGGFRVMLEARGLAMLHGLFASWVFSLMCCLALVTSKGWFDAENLSTESSVTGQWRLGIGISAITTVVAVQLQFILGGLLRHHHTAVFEHLGFAFLVLLSVMWLWSGAYTSGVVWLQGNAWGLACAVLGQIVLGLVTFVARFGFGSYVAVQGSALQIWVRTGHTVLGMLVWMLSLVYLVRILRIMWVRHCSATVSYSHEVGGPGLMTGGAP